MSPVTIRRATQDDLIRAPVTWLKPDGWRQGGHSFVELADDEIVGAAMRSPNRVHPTRDSAWIELPRTGSSGLLDALKDVGGLPLAIKARPGTREHAAAVSAGVRYQHCPPELVPTGTEPLRSWCEENQTVPARSGYGWTSEDLTVAWTHLYEVVHAAWAPTADRSTLLAEFKPMIAEELDARRTALCLIGGDLVAACFVFGTPDDSEVEAVAEALLPHHSEARAAVAACMARVLSEADGKPVMFDGHVSDPHFFPLLGTLPSVESNANSPLDLLEVPSR